MKLNSLIELDRAHLIHPVTAWGRHEKRGAIVLASAKGVFVTDSEGRTLVDGFAGLWCVNVGYGQDTIVEAAARQMRELPYATGYFGFASEPAILLAARLAELAPGDLDHVYFTLGGSDAVDSAVRFIRYFYNVTGRPAKKQMIALDKGYHGSTTFGAGLTGLPSFHQHFDAPLAIQHHIPAPYPYRHRTGADADVIADSVAALHAKVAELGGPDQVAALFCEPVQGSGGVIVPPRGWLTAMRQACDELGILLVVDEVITGFGRTGPLFACEHEGVVPDLMTTAKGLTSGYCPMGAVILSDRVYRAIADGAADGAAIGHGFTYSGHPVSAAVGLEVLRLYTEGGVLANGRVAGARLAARLGALADHPLVGDVRLSGMLAAVELVTSKANKTKPAPAFADHLARIAYEKGVIFRAFADGVAGFAPPLTCSEDEVDLIVDRFAATLDAMLDLSEIRDAID